MFLIGGSDRLVLSASDLRAASICEFALLRTVDEKLGLIPRADRVDDPVLKRAGLLGDRHEEQELERRRRAHGRAGGEPGRGVYEVPRPGASSVEALTAARDETFEALRAGYPVVFQGCFFDGAFQGYADFLVRSDSSGATPTYLVADTKLARRENVPALLQIAAYADQLDKGGIATADEAELILGDNSVHRYPLGDIVPVFRERWARLTTIVELHRSEGAAVAWNDPRFIACGRCETCQAEVEQQRDLLMVAGMRLSTRKKLRAHGLETIEDLAASDGSIAELPARSLATLRAQARLQVSANSAHREPGFEVFDPMALATLPPPSPGDIFFDFEGDPMWSVPGDRPGPTDWGIEYLFGVVEADGSFMPFWAHTRAEEKAALEDFIGYVEKRRATYPDLHIYHYAAYEKTALTRLAARHGSCEDAVDDLLREGVLVDLYAVVRQAIRISAGSYSIKALEPLYMGDAARVGEVKTASESMVEYANFCDARDLGEHEQADDILRGIESYNRDDCVSTLRLRDWLGARADDHGVTLTGRLREADVGDDATEPDDLGRKLTDLAGLGPQRDAGETAYAMLAAALGFNAREHKPFWWAHFDRLSNPVDEWADGRDVFAVHDASVAGDWAKPTPRSQAHRQSRLVGRFGAGSTASVGAKLQAVYDQPVPEGFQQPIGTLRGYKSGATIIERGLSDSADEFLVVDEILPKDTVQYPQFPIALVPSAPPPTTSIDLAIREVAESALGGFGAQPGLDVLLRRPPRLRGIDRLPSTSPTTSADEAIYRAVLSLDSSYIAVQGPPGTGKTYVGAEVVRRLVEQHHWRVGVVAQSHAVVENFLDCLVKHGLDPALAAKKRGKHDPAASWTPIADDDYASYLDEHQPTGCVVGGTAWDFTSTKRVARGSLDLLVIDEAGQFALATTLGVSVAAQRLLMLGDPQQLPQVSQGSHPEPVDESALGWLVEGEPTLPRARGYFLEQSWRMHPKICAAVSALSYDGKLRSRDSVTRVRSLDGVTPGLHVVRVAHRDNSTESPEEADEVVTQVARLVGRRWFDPRDEPQSRLLSQTDIRVVAPYNAQVNLIAKQLATAGFDDVPVGTVDKFQGQEAPVVIVSMTASARSEVPRGIGFLLNRNRINVSVSRGKWRSIVIRSEVLTDFSPTTPAELLELGAFIGLCDQADRGDQARSIS